jgi:ABC-type antimicrobial peptide transport system permease subunit
VLRLQVWSLRIPFEDAGGYRAAHWLTLRSVVVAMVMRGALWQILIGVVIGLPAALFAGHFMASLLYEVKAYDPLAFLGAILLLAICATVAGFIPARRAASIDPRQALRAD